MRIRAKDVLDLLAAGADRSEILADYPYLESDDIRTSERVNALHRRRAAAAGVGALIDDPGS